MKILLEGNTGDQKRLRTHLFYLSFNDKDCYLMNILEACLHLKLLTFGRNCLCVSALALKILSEGNPGDQERLRLFSLSSYVENR